ncbi:hypothetical protein NGRA_1559 [Nosema granulosis]|uniref:Uncharacterized protein n=1 Tax=Nosema granulosis TaxID=83296 RepID=A0A9P6KZ01_9MICR|nr:hypothetical protein NGRA_1559 [Nosema granulosis]
MMIMKLMLLISSLNCLEEGYGLDESVLYSFSKCFYEYFIERMRDIVIIDTKKYPKNRQLFILIAQNNIHFYYRDTLSQDRYTNVKLDNIFNNDYEDVIDLIYSKFKEEKDHQKIVVYLSFDERPKNGECVSYEESKIFIMKFREIFGKFIYLPYDMNFYIKMKNKTKKRDELYLRYKKNDYEAILYFSPDFYSEVKEKMLKQIEVEETYCFNKLAIKKNKKNNQYDSLDISITILLITSNELYNIDNDLLILILEHLLNKVNFEDEVLSVLEFSSDIEKNKTIKRI